MCENQQHTNWAVLLLYLVLAFKTSPFQKDQISFWENKFVSICVNGNWHLLSHCRLCTPCFLLSLLLWSIGGFVFSFKWKPCKYVPMLTYLRSMPVFICVYLSWAYVSDWMWVERNATDFRNGHLPLIHFGYIVS